jgi:hypothetical protein
MFKKLSSDKNWNKLRFKKLKNGYPIFKFPEHLIDDVDIEQFLLVEENRLPLFIGSQFGIHPNPNEIFKNVTKSILIAKMNKSLLSGLVSGLSISVYKEGVIRELEYFKN